MTRTVTGTVAFKLLVTQSRNYGHGGPAARLTVRRRAVTSHESVTVTAKTDSGGIDSESTIGWMSSLKARPLRLVTLRLSHSVAMTRTVTPARPVGSSCRPGQIQYTLLETEVLLKSMCC